MATDEKKSGGAASKAGKADKTGGGKSDADKAGAIVMSRAMMVGQLALAMAAVGLVGGLMAAQLAGSPRAAKAATDADAHAEHGHAKHGAANDAPPVDDKFVYIELDPVIVNLDEHRMLRYVRASVIIELDATNKKQLKTTQDLIERRKLVLKNRLTLFLAGRTPDEVRGDKALRHLERQIRDDFNQELWPDKKGLIHDVLFKEFAVQ